MKNKGWLRPVGFVVAVEVIGLISGLLAGNIRQTYESLIQPPLSPPAWIFGVVWPILYALMGIAAWLVVRDRTQSDRGAMFWFTVQLVLNFSWSIIFFRFELFWAALAILIALDVVVAYTIYLFGKINRTAARLMIPYLVWIVFATWLNLGTAILN